MMTQLPWSSTGAAHRRNSVSPLVKKSVYSITCRTAGFSPLSAQHSSTAPPSGAGRFRNVQNCIPCSRPSGCGARAKEEDLVSFKNWTAKAVSVHLKRYGLETNKSCGRKVYGRVTPDKLTKIQENYGIELGFDEKPGGPTGAGNVPYMPYVPRSGVEIAEDHCPRGHVGYMGYVLQSRREPRGNGF